jgi:hypothetical protein
MSEEKEVIETQESKDQSDANKELNKSSNFDLESILGEDLYDFYLKNKNQSIAVVIGLATIIVAFLGYKFVYMDMFVTPTEKESIEKIWQAESIAFDQQNWSQAIAGDSLGFFSGFKKLVANMLAIKEEKLLNITLESPI